MALFLAHPEVAMDAIRLAGACAMAFEGRRIKRLIRAAAGVVHGRQDFVSAAIADISARRRGDARNAAVAGSSAHAGNSGVPDNSDVAYAERLSAARSAQVRERRVHIA